VKKPLAVQLASLGIACAIGACGSIATDDELAAMCSHLAELRKEQPDETKTKQCIADAKREGTTPKQARCRAAAVNLQEYWVRCRTGEARKR
jgi:hypothetical protein